MAVEWDSGSDFDEQDSQLQWATNLSLAGNVALLLVKAYAFAVSGSFAVLASLADSGVDLASQVVLFFCNRSDFSHVTEALVSSVLQVIKKPMSVTPRTCTVLGTVSPALTLSRLNLYPASVHDRARLSHVDTSSAYPVKAGTNQIL